ncbi:ribonuclease HII [Alkalibacterium sp. 20]|uniref:ribonuclease HII n=1 Tax=Alkalibacterium sp. 20 TaxID=1798803 RepID=UPI0009002E45|nr:ribonuclease HII [Alkalibacterium sp. 20]
MKDQKTSTQKTLTIKAIKDNLKANGDISSDYLAELKEDPRKGVQLAIKQYETRIGKQALLYENYELMQAYERAYRKKGKQFIAGIDEVGRGPLAGPVVSAAVILPEEPDLVGINDSKQLSEAEREKWAVKIKQVALAINYSIVSPEIIDSLNIYQATKVSMKESVEGLGIKPDCLLIDAMRINSTIHQEKIIKGDAKSISIAAASIIAKVTRDNIMKDLAVKYPGYGFERNAGYGTKDHLEGLKNLGVTPIHRQSFRPVKDLL